MKKLAATTLISLGLGLSLGASAATVVPGTANPNLAGRADGYACCSGDSVPGQSAVLVTGVSFSGGQSLSFSVTGRTNNAGGAAAGQSPGAPDGDGVFSMTNYGDGLSAPLSVPLNALVGVFLAAGSPTGSATPAQLDFTGGLDFASLGPQLGQIFFIGDGRTSLNQGPDAGLAQAFIVPVGATRLFLGSSDGFGWSNNSGDFTVTVTNLSGEPALVPLPAAGWLMLVGVGLLGRSARRRTVG